MELEYGNPTILSTITESEENSVFSGKMISGLLVIANFSNNNGSLWIKDNNKITIWEAEFVNGTIFDDIFISDPSETYVLIANSSTLGINTLLYTFSAGYSYYTNIGLVFVILTIIISFCCMGFYIPFAVRKGRKFAKRFVP
ncbi:MAG: hypothetical protein ACFFAS_14155 [Promethearchaeota archaeon]